MITLSQTRADARALFSAALAGGAVGLVLGACYLAGGLASAATRHQTVSRVAVATGGAYSDTALMAAPGADTGTLAVLRRRTSSTFSGPNAFSGDVEQERQVAVLADRLQRQAGEASAGVGARLLLRASLGGAYNPAAAPFRNTSLNSARELECLTQAVYYEARGEGPNGQAAVAQVVLNRVRHPAFPKSICGVVFQRANGVNCQFSFACDGSLRRTHEPAAWRRSQRIASRALDGVVMADVGNATHFHTVSVAPTWGPHLMRVAQVGLHVFYRFGGRSGAPGAFDRRPQPSDPTMDLMVAGLTNADAPSVAIAAVAQAANASAAVSQTLAPIAKPAEPAAPIEGVKTTEAATKAQPASVATQAQPMKVAAAS